MPPRRAPFPGSSSPHAREPSAHSCSTSSPSATFPGLCPLERKPLAGFRTGAGPAPSWTESAGAGSNRPGLLLIQRWGKRGVEPSEVFCPAAVLTGGTRAPQPRSVPSTPAKEQGPAHPAPPPLSCRRPVPAVGSGAHPALPSGSRPCPGTPPGEAPWGQCPPGPPLGEARAVRAFPRPPLPGRRGLGRRTRSPAQRPHLSASGGPGCPLSRP